MHFKVFVSDLETGIEYTVPKPDDDATFGGVGECLKDSEALERDLGRLES